MAPGDAFVVHVRGVGWTETANTYMVVLDNGTIGYACGFNSQGDVVMSLRAPGASGLHTLDLYPTIYNGDLSGVGALPAGSSAAGNYFLNPMLNIADHPGEMLPAFHLTFTVR